MPIGGRFKMASNTDDLAVVFLIPFSAIALLVLLGVLWSPFSALFCAILAGRRDKNIVLYAMVGFVTSLLLFLPGLYIIARLREKPVAEEVVIGAQVFILIIWAFGPLALSILVASNELGANWWWQWWAPKIPWNPVRLVFAAFPVSSIILWAASSMTVVRFVRKMRRHGGIGRSTGLPGILQLTPFFLLPVSLLLSFLLYGTLFAIDPDGTKYP